jgi:hypothetical protein
MDIEELRQKLDSVKSQLQGRGSGRVQQGNRHGRGILAGAYGTQAPAVEVLKLLRKMSIADAEAATHSPEPSDLTATGAKKIPDGVSVEQTPDGFLLRASDRSFVPGIFWIGLAIHLGVLPFRLFPDLIRGLWTAAGLSFWLTSAFFAVWAGGTLYVVWMGALGLFGEVRIAKSGDSGEIFTGIGKVGRTHRVRWSDYYGAGERSVASSSSRSARTEHFIGLNGRSSSYRFGSELNANQHTFVIVFLREQVFGLVPQPECHTAAAQTAGDGKTVSGAHSADLAEGQGGLARSGSGRVQPGGG